MSIKNSNIPAKSPDEATPNPSVKHAETTDVVNPAANSSSKTFTMFSNQIIPPFATQKDNSRQKTNESPQKTKQEEVLKAAQVANEPSTNTLHQLVLSLAGAEVPKTENSNNAQATGTNNESNRPFEDASKI